MLRRSRRHVPYTRRQYREQLRPFLRVNGVLLALVALFFIAFGAVAAFLMSGYALGMLHGLLIAGYLTLVLTTFLLVTGAHRSLAGSWGEDNTQDVLRKARRRRLVSGWVDNLEIPSGDVDHLVVRRDGSLLVLDSKWRADIDYDGCRRSVAQAVASAGRARNILRHVGLARPEVTPVVVVWGGAQSDLPEPWIQVDGVAVVRGKALVEWLRNTDGGAPKRAGDETRKLLRDLRTFRRSISVATVRVKTASGSPATRQGSAATPRSVGRLD